MKHKSIIIHVALKNPRTIARAVKAYPFTLGATPETLGELIELTVKATLSAYNERAESAKSPTPLTDEELEGMRELGKFAFGVHFNENKPSEEKAINTALEAVTDGIVRVFRGDEELTDIDKKIQICEGDVFTFVKLTMLSGRMW